jgi:hypothetical protein
MTASQATSSGAPIVRRIARRVESTRSAHQKGKTAHPSFSDDSTCDSDFAAHVITHFTFLNGSLLRTPEQQLVEPSVQRNDSQIGWLAASSDRRQFARPPHRALESFQGVSCRLTSPAISR